MKKIFPFFCVFIFIASWAQASAVVQAKRQAQQRAQQQAMMQQMMVQRQLQQQALQQMMIQQQILKQAIQNPSATSVTLNNTSSQTQTVDIESLWQALQTSSQIWTQIIDLAPKVMIVDRFIQLFRNQGVIISKSAIYYVSRIDEMIAQNPSLLSGPFKDILMIAAISDYDFDNGQNKDALALQVLGQAAYLQNKIRLGLP